MGHTMAFAIFGRILTGQYGTIIYGKPNGKPLFPMWRQTHMGHGCHVNLGCRQMKSPVILRTLAGPVICWGNRSTSRSDSAFNDQPNLSTGSQQPQEIPGITNHKKSQKAACGRTAQKIEDNKRDLPFLPGSP